MFFRLRNLIRCGLAIAIVALPPTAGCRNWWKANTTLAAESTQPEAARA